MHWRPVLPAALHFLLLMPTCLAQDGATTASPPAAYFPLQPLAGLADPTLAFGLQGVADWSGVLPFVDAIKVMRPWIGGRNGVWESMNARALAASGCLDDDGWPRCIPAGSELLRGVFAWGPTGAADGRDSRAGRYHLRWKGGGGLAVRNVSILHRGPHHIVFDIAPAQGNWWLEVGQVNVDSSEGFPREISLVREDHLALAELGFRFRPDWLALVADARQLRFMDWSSTNNSELREWTDRPRQSHYTWALGVPFEVQIALANFVHADPWFTIPHDADDGFVRSLAELVKRDLAPGLTAWVEFTNEAWNWQFVQTRVLVAAGRQQLGTEQLGAWYRVRATEVMAIWREVFADDADSRLVRVIGTQTANPFLTGVLLDGAAWRDAQPARWQSASDAFDALAVTTYFGNRLHEHPDFVDSLLAGETVGFAALGTLLQDNDSSGSIPVLASRLAQQKALADRHGLRLVAYEGGQHVHHFVEGVTDRPDIVVALAEFVRSDAMAALYDELWGVWQDVGDGPFMQFVEAGVASQYGSWGLRIDLEDAPPRAKRLDALNASNESWWPRRAGADYRQGRIIDGSAGNADLTGTARADVLLGGAGNDVFYAGSGDDYMHGGGGDDIARFTGRCAMYRIETLADGVLSISGPDGNDRLVGFSQLEFADDDTNTLERVGAPYRCSRDEG